MASSDDKKNEYFFLQMVFFLAIRVSERKPTKGVLSIGAILGFSRGGGGFLKKNKNFVDLFLGRPN